MGIDLLDFSLRIEREFGIEALRAVDLNLPERSPWDATAGELYEWVIAACREQGAAVRRGSWNRVRLVLARTLGTSPWKIRRETWIVRELGFN